MAKRSDESLNSARVQQNVTLSLGFFYSPACLQGLFIIALVISWIWPVCLFFAIPVALVSLLIFISKPFRMPLRMPTDLNQPDLTEEQEGFTENKGVGGLFRHINRTNKISKGRGILYLGYQRGKNLAREMWLTLDDCLRHMVLFATTGSGKTEALLSVMLNALCWGRGFCISDGKAENTLAFSVWSLARRFGREDDFLVLNFLTGDKNKFAELLKQEKHQSSASNSMTLFANASPTYIIQLMESLLPNASGDEGWQDKAKAMISALIYALCYKRERDNIVLSQAIIQSYLPLKNMVELYVESQRNDWHKEGYMPLENYLKTLAGFDMKLIEKPSEWSVDVFNQHGYLIQQFTRMLTMFNDIYGHVFPAGMGDINLKDVLHNDRILVVLIPALELSNGEAASLGKLYFSALRMAISHDLGAELEGKKSEIILTQKYKAQFPYPVIGDEVGYYFSSGLDRLASQMRSLSYMLLLAGQDVQAMKRSAKGELDSVLANAQTKWFMALEDPNDTYEVIRKSAGKGYYSELSSFRRGDNLVGKVYSDSENIAIREKDNIELTELKGLNPGQGVIVFKDAVVRNQALYIPNQDKQSEKLALKINRFVEINPITSKDLMACNPDIFIIEPVPNGIIETSLGIILYMQEQEKALTGPILIDPILDELITCIMDIENTSQAMSADEQGALLVNDIKTALKQHGSTYHVYQEPRKNKATPEQLNAATR